jgi:hypothetical protein
LLRRRAVDGVRGRGRGEALERSATRRTVDVGSGDDLDAVRAIAALGAARHEEQRVDLVALGRGILGKETAHARRPHAAAARSLAPGAAALGPGTSRRWARGGWRHAPLGHVRRNVELPAQPLVRHGELLIDAVAVDLLHHRGQRHRAPVWLPVSFNSMISNE